MTDHTHASATPEPPDPHQQRSASGFAAAGGDGRSAAADGSPAERDTPMTATYVAVLVVEAAIIAALWALGRIYS